MIKTRKIIPGIVVSILALLPVVNWAAEELNIDFTYERNVNIGSINSVLSLPAFGDERGMSDANLITDDYRVQEPLADIVRDAFAQGFAKGGVELVDSGEDMQVVGTVTESGMEIVDRGGVQSIQMTIRAHIQLQSGGRTVWENTLFGRGTVPESEGVVAAVNASLERLVRELFNDDYFIIEL
ncbi:MAG: hypothetical protein O2948_13970 [Proteobacteria bacterium]|jgi:hypothetical protein|nr:hypothetical protein [Pseudomonadota bacterium]MDA0927505.1 hypothetical protein [Pseudomonadota bacterium]